MTPAIGRSRIVRRCRTTSNTNRLTRAPRSSSEKLFGPAAMMRRRLATWAPNAPTKVRNKSQKASVPITLRVPSGLHRLDDRRHDLEQVPDDPVVGDLEDRRIGVLVDRDDRVGALHADQVLDGARDAERQVE